MSLPRLALVLLLSTALPGHAQEAAAPLAEATLPVVTLATTAPFDFRQEIALTGSFLPREEVQVSTAASGQAVVALLADLGDTVAKGDVLARLDDRGLSVQLDQAWAEAARAMAALHQAQTAIASGEAALKRAEQNLSRMVSLNATGAATRTSLEEAEAAEAAARATDASNRDGVTLAEAGVAVAEAAVKLAEKNLADATVLAPANGVISARAVELGQVVVAGQAPLFRILRDGEIELSAQVLESDIALIAPGQEVAVTLSGARVLQGQVRLVSPTVDSVTRMGNLRISVTDPDRLARAGMFASARVLVTARQGLGVPSGAVITKGDRPEVLVFGAEGVLEERAVSLGLYTGGNTEILSGLTEGDRVVARASAFFASGDRVQEAAQ